MVQLYARSVEYPGAKHPGIVLDQHLKLSYSPKLLCTTVSTNDVIGTARVSNGVFRVVTERRIRYKVYFFMTIS